MTIALVRPNADRQARLGIYSNTGVFERSGFTLQYAWLGSLPNHGLILVAERDGLAWNTATAAQDLEVTIYSANTIIQIGQFDVRIGGRNGYLLGVDGWDASAYAMQLGVGNTLAVGLWDGIDDQAFQSSFVLVTGVDNISANNVQGIALTNEHVRCIDRANGIVRAWHRASTAEVTAGDRDADFDIVLDVANSQPVDLTTDGVTLLVSDASGMVYAYGL